MPLKILSGALLAAGAALQSEGESGARLLTLEQTIQPRERVSFAAGLPTWRFAPDGVHLVRREGDEHRWVDPRTLEEREPPEPENGDESERARPPARRRAPSEELHALSPDRRFEAFVRENDLWVLDTAADEARALTRTASDDLLNGKLDWVYQEEVYGRGQFRAHWWSPDSARIAFLSLDVSDVPRFPIVDDLPREGPHSALELMRYPKPGDPNPRARLGIVELESGEIRWVHPSHHEEDDLLIVRVQWTPSGDGLAFMVQDRVQSRLDVLLADPATGAVRTLFRERSGTWVRRGRSGLRWLADGSFLWLSERTGRRHLYHYRTDGSLVRAVTSGTFNVQSILRVDEETELLWLMVDGDGTLDEHLYRVRLDGTELTRLTRGPGRHSATLDERGERFLDVVSTIDEPPSVRLCDADGEVLAVLGEARVPALEEYLTSTWELERIAARDGYPLDVAVLRPVPFDAGASYPVWLTTYSGPGSQTVRNQWRGDAWHQFLAQQGVIVLQVNVRSASGRGHWADGLAHRRLGVQELRDLEDAVRWLSAHPWADAARVGIGGHSYGGFMAAYALVKSELFALGIAGSGVYDWRLYDTIYTERYMGTPEQNPEGYAETSVIEAAAGLRGHLVLTHGTLDDNVHVQNTLRLAHALQSAGRPFEMMLYPKSAHGIRDANQRWHHRQLEWRAIREHLRPPGPAPSTASATFDPASAAGSR